MKRQVVINQNDVTVASIVGKWERSNKIASGYTKVHNLEFKESGTWIKTITILENSNSSTSNGTWNISGNILIKTNQDSKIEEKMNFNNSYLTITKSNGTKRKWLRQ